MPPGPAMLALRTGAALHPVSIWPETVEGWRPAPAGHQVPRRGARAGTSGTTRAKVTAMTQQVADVFGAAIAEHPADWHMLQPLWLADLDPARTRRTVGSP